VSPLYFVGAPSWRSALLAAGFAAPWLCLLARGRLRRPWVWVTLLLGAVVFPLSIAWVQVPIQNGINALYRATLAVGAIERLVLLTGVPLVLMSGLVQEPAKLGISIAGLHLVGEPRVARAALALGAAAGAGYGAMEAFWVFNNIFATGFTWATVQLGGVQALLGFVERFFAVMFHIGAASLAAYGYATRRPWRYLFLAVGLHFLDNYTVLFLQAKLIGAVSVEILGAAIASATLAVALWLRYRFSGAPPAETPTEL
jgi:hypothetical protein